VEKNLSPRKVRQSEVNKKMNVLIIYAHPNPQSFNAAMRDTAVKTLTENGHTVKVSDLYAMKFKAVLDQDDFLRRKNPDEFKPEREQLHAAKTGTFVGDIREEIEKMQWADLLLFQFPLWWTAFPAIMKGWIDRVFAPGIAFNAAEQRHYDTGLLKGKKAMLAFTAGSSKEMYSRGGVHGDITALLTYITHAIFEYVGMEALPSFIVWGAPYVPEEERDRHLEEYRERLRSL